MRQIKTKEDVVRDQAFALYRKLRAVYVARGTEADRLRMERASIRYSRRAMKTNRGY